MHSGDPMMVSLSKYLESLYSKHRYKIEHFLHKTIKFSFESFLWINIKHIDSIDDYLEDLSRVTAQVRKIGLSAEDSGASNYAT